MKKKLLSNPGLKLASLALAFILWFLVVQIEDPLSSVTFSNVEIKLVNTKLLEQENKVYEVLDNTNQAKVTVYAPRSVISQIRKSDVVAEADMGKLTDINTIAVNYYVDNVAVNVVEGSQDVIRLNVEEKSSKWIRLQGNVVGEVPDGYMIYNTSLDQTTIEISGPESVVSRVEYAAVDISVNGATSNLSANVDIQLYNDENEVLRKDNIKMNTDSAHMTVEVLAYKDVPVRVEYTGTPAAGYMATGVTESSKRWVTVAGRPYVLEDVREIVVPGEAMDITGQDDVVTNRVDLAEYLPANVRWADKNFDSTAVATVYIEPVVKRNITVPAGNVSLINLPENVTAKLSEAGGDFRLTVGGLADQVNALWERGITGIVDVAAFLEEQEVTQLKTATYEIPVVFTLPEGISSENEIKASVEITAVTE